MRRVLVALWCQHDGKPGQVPDSWGKAQVQMKGMMTMLLGLAIT